MNSIGKKLMKTCGRKIKTNVVHKSRVYAVINFGWSQTNWGPHLKNIVIRYEPRLYCGDASLVKHL